MRVLSFLILVAGCATGTAPSNSSGDPLALTGTIPDPGPCPYPVMEVASGVDIRVHWSNLDTDLAGAPIDVPNKYASLSTIELLADASTAEVACNDSFSGYVNGIRGVYREEDAVEAFVPSDRLPDGGATVLDFMDADMINEHMRRAAILLQPTTSSAVTEVEITADAWVY